MMQLLINAFLDSLRVLPLVSTSAAADMPTCNWPGSGVKPRGPKPTNNKRDPAKDDATLAQTIAREDILFRSFHRPLKADMARTDSFGFEAFRSPPARKPGLVLDRPGTVPPRLGEQVRILGMSRRKELNGVLGRVVNDQPDEHGRVYIDIGGLEKGGKGQAKVVKVLGNRLELESDPSVPQWMPKGIEKLDELGASQWSTTGVRTGFPGFGLIHSKSLSQSAPLLPALSGEKLRHTTNVSHRSASRTTYGGFFEQKDEE
mmetsp:Transcript_71822/g.126849  ORF Transcript_71822/g.126849 Transcript_71822/m.126849 type:complete len:260 (+) Transcript_71822:3-782(+)